MNKREKLQWEIQQLSVAIDYFERAVDQAFFSKDVEDHAKTIKKLQKQISKLERKLDNAPS